MTNPHQPNPFADLAPVSLGYDDPFADERVKLAEVLLLRAAHLATLGLVILERLPLDALRRVAAMDRAA